MCMEAWFSQIQSQLYIIVSMYVDRDFCGFISVHTTDDEDAVIFYVTQ